MCCCNWALAMQGVQFHPESIITKNGHRIVSNFLRGLGVVPEPLPEDRQGSAAAAALSSQLPGLRHSLVAC